MHKVPAHIWRTVDGRYVETGHVDAAVLAYAKGDEVDDKTAHELGLIKQAQPAANKARAKPNDK
jgi:hypothetical protein